MKKTLLFIIATLACTLSSGQVIPHNLLAVTLNGTNVIRSTVNPNTGAVSTLAVLPTVGPTPYGGLNSAYNCDTQDYIFGGYTHNNEVIVTDGSTGAYKNPFGYEIYAMAYNRVTKRYYGLENNDFVSFDPVNGIRTVLSTFTVPLSNIHNGLMGYFVNCVTGEYVTIVYDQPTTSFGFIRFSCANGSYTLSPSFNVNGNKALFYWPVCDNTTGKIYGMAGQQQPAVLNHFASIDVATGSITPIMTHTFFISMSGGNNIRGGYALEENAGVYSFIHGSNTIININIATGALISTPQLSNINTGFIQYEGDCMQVAAGIQELYDNEQPPVYFDMYGNKVAPEPGKILIEMRGKRYRKMIIQE